MRLNPFASLERPREVWAWGMYDLANQSFQLLINTLLFSVYLRTVVAPNPAAGEKSFALMIAVSLIVVVVLSPILGSWADARGCKKRMLIGTGLVCVPLMACLYFLDQGMIPVAMALYIPAAVCCGLGENFLASFLPEIATQKTMGKVSAIGWTMSYVGALLLLAITWLIVYGLKMEEPSRWKVIFLLAAGWFAAGMLPSMFFLREGPAHAPTGERLGVTRRLMNSLAEMRRFRELARFLTAFFVYSFGTQTVIYFASVIVSEFNFGLRELILFALIMALGAGFGATGAGIYQDRIGQLRTVRIFLLIWVLGTLGLALVEPLSLPRGVFWGIAAVVGVALGGIGTSSRAVVGVFTPASKASEFFGNWGMIYKLAGVVGPAVFVAAKTQMAKSTALFLLVGFFVAGFVLLMRVNESTGRARALEANGAGSQGA